ncbi:MAG: preprotein translocase subunit SecE [SAR202 cluster bacterium]|nr:preprotein translocase subunit SecE [SAR202 cluster bacterium]
MANRPTGAALRRPSSEEVRRFSPFRFLGEVVSELRKCVWPSRDETVRLTIVVLVVGGFVGALLGVFDFGFSRTFTKYIVLP